MSEAVRVQLDAAGGAVKVGRNVERQRIGVALGRDTAGEIDDTDGPHDCLRTEEITTIEVARP